MKKLKYFALFSLFSGLILASFKTQFWQGGNNFKWPQLALAETIEKKVENQILGPAKKSLGARTILPSPVWVIGSYDKNGRPNAMTSAWAGICCSRPPCVTISLRKETYTYGNIMEKKAFTVNIPSESQAAYAAYVGSVSGRDVDKFKETGLTPVKSDLVDAPYIKEFPLILECKLKQTVEIGSHTMFIGEIVDIKADESILTEDGSLDLEKLKGFVFLPGRGRFYRYGEFLGEVASLANKIKEK